MCICVYIYVHIHIHIYFREFPCSRIRVHALLAAFKACENRWQTPLLQKAFKVVLVLVKIEAYTQSACEVVVLQ